MLDPKLIFFLFLFYCLNPVNSLDAETENNHPIGNVTIFIYHKFGEDKYPTTNVAVSRFEEQLQYLKENKYTILSLNSLVELLEKQTMLPDKAAVITIDDGYTSTYTDAWPLLKKYGYPFTVFLYVKAVSQNYRNFLTWDQIQEMQRSGADFQDHGYSHYRFGDIPTGMDDVEYERWIFADLQKGNQILEKHLGYKPKYLALPYGEYNSISKKVASELGYKAVFSQDPGSISRHTDILAIPREPILGNDWASMTHFAEVLSKKDLPVENVYPPQDPLSNLTPDSFCASVVNPNLYRRESFEIYVSELGWKKGQFRENRFCINNDATLERRSNRVAIRALEKGSGATAMRYWLLIKK